MTIHQLRFHVSTGDPHDHHRRPIEPWRSSGHDDCDNAGGIAQTHGHFKDARNTPKPVLVHGDPLDGGHSVTLVLSMPLTTTDALYTTPGPSSHMGLVVEGSPTAALRYGLSRRISQHESPAFRAANSSPFICHCPSRFQCGSDRLFPLRHLPRELPISEAKPIHSGTKIANCWRRLSPVSKFSPGTDLLRIRPSTVSTINSFRDSELSYQWDALPFHPERRA